MQGPDTNILIHAQVLPFCLMSKLYIIKKADDKLLSKNIFLGEIKITAFQESH